MMRRAPLSLAFGVASLAFACSSTAVSTPIPEEADPPVPTSAGEDGGPPADAASSPKVDASTPDAAPRECSKMDIVFVVDDSGSMAPPQAKFNATFPDVINTLNTSKTKSGAPIDYRLGVTTTDTTRTNLTNGGSGGFVTLPNSGCNAGAAQRAWLERSDGDLASFLACRAGVGTLGSATEKPIDGLVLSVTARQADQNAGFIRTEALLGFVILTDEEDSSTNTPEATIQALDTLKQGRSRWAGAVISGQKAGSCTSAGHSAGQAPKLHALVEGAANTTTGKNNVIWSSICQDSLSAAMTQALGALTRACRDL